jgi:hypothetical protein
LAAALFVFRDFGLTWDEPLFYAYGDALGYAYSPVNWLSLILTRTSYGPAGGSQNRGPVTSSGCLRSWIAGGQVALTPHGTSERIHVSLQGVFVYRIGLWLSAETAALFGRLCSRALLWSHAFINPKDMPFWCSLLELSGQGECGGSALSSVLKPRCYQRACRNHAWSCHSIRVLGPLAARWWAFIGWQGSPDGVRWRSLHTVLRSHGDVRHWPYVGIPSTFKCSVLWLKILRCSGSCSGDRVPPRGHCVTYVLPRVHLDRTRVALFFVGLTSISTPGRDRPPHSTTSAVGWICVPVAMSKVRPPCMMGCSTSCCIAAVFVLSAAGASGFGWFRGHGCGQR